MLCQKIPETINKIVKIILFKKCGMFIRIKLDNETNPTQPNPNKT